MWERGLGAFPNSEAISRKIHECHLGWPCEAGSGFPKEWWTRELTKHMGEAWRSRNTKPESHCAQEHWSQTASIRVLGERYRRCSWLNTTLFVYFPCLNNNPRPYTHTHTLHGHVPTQSLNRTHKNLGYLAEPRLTHVIIFCTTVFQEAHGPKRVKGRSAKNKRGTSYTIQRRKETRKQICIAWKRSASWFLPQAICIVHN